MNRSTGIVIGVLVAFASSVAATGSTPPGLPWVTARKPVNISVTNGTYSDPALNVSTTDDSVSSGFQPTSNIQNSCTADDGETFSPASILQFTGSYTVGESGVGDASITTPSAVVINRTMTATGANGTPTITASNPVLKIQNDASAAGTGVITDTASTLEVENNNTASTGPGLKITQKAIGANAAEFWDMDSLNASIDDQGNVSCRDVTSTNEVRGAVLSTLTTVDLYDPAPSANRISIQAPSGTASWLMLLPPNDGNAGDVLTTDGTGTASWSAPATGDITAVGSMTSGAAFADSTADGDWLGLGSGAGRIEFDDLAVDEINILGALLIASPYSSIDTSTTITNTGFPVNSAENSPANGGYAAWTFSDTPGQRAVFALERARGTAASPSPLSAGDLIGDLVFNGRTDDRRQAARILVTAATGWGATGSDSPGQIELQTTPDGSETSLTRVFVASGGNVGIGTDSTPDTLLDVQGSFSAGTNGEMSVDTSGNITTSADLAVNGGDITTTAATMNLIPSAATAINIGTTTSADINIGDSSSTVDFGDTASAATAFLPDADAGADLGTSAKHFRAAYFNQEFTGPVHRCTADANCTVATTDRYVFMNEQASQRYVILPAANISGQTISIMTGNNSGAVTVTVCTQQDANCGSTGTDVIDSSNTTTFGTPTNTQRTSIGNGRRYISDGAGVWIELPTL